MRRLVDRKLQEPGASEDALCMATISSKDKTVSAKGGVTRLENPGYQTRSLFFSATDKR